MSDKTDREKYLKVLEKLFYSMEKLESGVIFPTSEVKTALAFAISSIKTDLKYDLLYEETTHIADADKKIDPTIENNLAVDCISRQAVLDLIADYDLSMGQVVKGIHALPSVTPIRPKGHWIEQIDHEENCRTLICSNCDRPALHDGDSIWKHKFCPHCGSDMREVEE